MMKRILELYKIKFFGMFGGRYMEQKLDYENKMENKLESNIEYFRYKIEKINENIIPLFKFLFVLVLVGNAILFFIFCKMSKKKQKKALLDNLEKNKI